MEYLEKLEFNKVTENLATFSKTFIGKKYCTNLYPFNDKNKVIKALNETNEAVIFKYKKGNIPIYELSEEIEICLKTLKSNKILSIANVLNIGKFLRLAKDLKDYFFSDELINLNEFNSLYNYFDNLCDCLKDTYRCADAKDIILLIGAQGMDPAEGLLENILRK